VDGNVTPALRTLEVVMWTPLPVGTGRRKGSTVPPTPCTRIDPVVLSTVVPPNRATPSLLVLLPLNVIDPRPLDRCASSSCKPA
jgi:hypothetical protein